ncbi:unnamed protein product [Arabidopsis lyrata]|nr:uncharacterized protein LOC9317409 [Arabidopsis lyrata subsp. lyrata]CAH8264720.1 unnamed protein product [Arabidopsis lyrata]|eukprot:XP_002881342.2 uncharacterized protein LOC9317409 [Arabidopsis lyrata subsp. lyrata]
MVNQSKNKFSMKTKYGAALAPVFLLAGAYVAWNYINHGLWRKKDDKNSHRDIRKRVSEQRRDGNAKNMGKEASSGRDERTLSKSVSMGAIRGGKLALQRLLDLHSYRVDTSSLANAEIEFEALLSKENPDFGLLQRDIVKMEMSGKEANGVELLKKALEKARKEGKGHEAYEIEMLLVEMLIYLGNIEEASKCKCLEDEVITDARRPLYQSIIHYLRGDPMKQVEETFNRFRDIQIGLQWPGSSEECEIEQVTFDEFKKVMESLKQEIEDGNKRKLKLIKDKTIDGR